MIVSVIPIRRLPRGITYFDYTAPLEHEREFKQGQLVRIPFQKSELFGIVLSFERAENKALKPVTALVHPEPFLSVEQLDFLENLSQQYNVSLATLLKMSLLPLQRRKLKSVSLVRSSQFQGTLMRSENLVSSKPQNNSFLFTPYPLKPTYSHYQTQTEHISALRKAIKKSTIILVPEVHLIEEVFSLLSKEQQLHALIWHSGLSIKEQFERWLQVRNGEKSVIIGTRSAVFLPLQKLDTIIIDYEHDDNHKHWDQAPRFHAKDVAKKLADLHGAQLHLMSFSPSVESYFGIHKKQITSPSTTFCNIRSTFCNLKDDRRAGNYSPLSKSAQQAILDAEQDVFLYINRLGFATSVGCNACGHIVRSEKSGLPLVFHSKTKTLHNHYTGESMPAPQICTRCNKAFTQLRGTGTEQVEELVRTLLGKSSKHKIIRIDSDIGVPEKLDTKPRIIIGTRMAFPLVRWDQNELTVLVDIDKQLNIPEFNAGELVWHLIHEISFRQNKRANLLIQTFDPQQLILRSLKVPNRFYRTDLNHRRSLGYPPYAKLVRYFFGNGDIRVAKQEVARVHADLNKHKKSAILSQAIEMHPRYYRRKFWYMILVKLPVDTWESDLLRLNKIIPGNWKVDVNPISILSP